MLSLSFKLGHRDFWDLGRQERRRKTAKKKYSKIFKIKTVLVTFFKLQISIFFASLELSMIYQCRFQIPLEVMHIMHLIINMMELIDVLCPTLQLGVK